MKNQKNIIFTMIFAIIFLFIFSGIKSIAQEQTKQEVRREFTERLKGSDGVYVLIEVIAQKESDKKSLAEEIQKEVEEQLKDSKIRILTREESDAAPGMPRLSINLITYKEPSQKDVYLYSFRIVHYEISSMLRTERFVEGICWESGLYIGMEKSPSIIKAIKKQLQDYIKDYNEANSFLL